MSDLGLPRVPRPAFFAGQLLGADDLEGALAGQTALRALHNRALHGWGIALGLSVIGPSGAKTITVEPGYAIDGAGEDLVLVDRATLAVPPVSAGPDSRAVAFAITIARTPDAEAELEGRSGPCGATGAVWRSDAPTVRWQRPGDVREALDVVLATAAVRNCALDGPLSTVVRHSALAPARPHVAAGATPAGGTAWRLWPDASGPVGVVTTVSTAEAGFGDTPRYHARLDGRRTDATRTAVNELFAVDGFAHVDQATAASFDFIVVLPTGATATSAGNVAGRLTLNPAVVLTDSYMVELEARLEWRVVWSGVEG